MSKRMTAVIGAAVLSALVTFAPKAYAWDHPGHMITAAIAYTEIERARPDLIDKIGLLFLKHPDPAPFWGRPRHRSLFVMANTATTLKSF